MTRAKRPSEMSSFYRELQGLLIRLAISAGLLALALALASRFS